MGIHEDLHAIRNCRKSLLHITMLTSIVAALTASAGADDGQLIGKHRPAIPFCDDNHDRSIARRLLYITTLDGRLSALDITKSGKLHWSIPTGPGPLISSSIHRLELTNNGQFVRMIPSLSGGIYKFDGESIDPIPITTENLLSSSAKFSDDLVISGGKETRTYGVSARTGKLLYECSMHGCVNSTDAETDSTTTTSNANGSGSDSATHNYGSDHDPLLDDVIIVRRQTQTVRAVESRTGVERWNFSVGQHELDMIKSAECHDRQVSQMDMAILDLDVKVVVPEGIICAFSKIDPDALLWKYKFDHPIVSAWKTGVSEELESIDMFGSAQWLWDHDDNIFESPYPSVSPSIYLGMYEKQLYIQESINLRREIIGNTDLYTHLTTQESIMPKIPWRPIAASSNSLVMFQDEKIINGATIPPQINDPNIQGNELVPYEEDIFAISAQSVLNASEFVNGNGFYLYTKNDLNKTEVATCGTEINLPAIEDAPAGNHTIHGVSDDIVFNMDDMNAPVKIVILSLWYWWKEIIVIAFTSAVLLNLALGQRHRPEREIVVIERHIPVPTAIEATESSTEALLGPVNNLTKTNSSGMNGHRSLSESTSLSTDNFVSRFQNDFEMLRCLGRGGFGVVFEAKNKLDDCKYAVKRITLPSKEVSRERVMREVKTLAHCEHHNIVRYFHAWVETPPAGWQEDEDKRLLLHEASTSIQIETPDGSTLPSLPVAAFQGRDNRFLQPEKKKLLMSWVSSVASTACSSDHDCNQIENSDDDDDSSIVFRSESQSAALREENTSDTDTSEGKENAVGHHKKSQFYRTSQSQAISIDIHSDSFDLSLNNNGRNIDYSKLSDSFQIEFVRSAGGEEQNNNPSDIQNTHDIKSITAETQRRRRLLSLQLNKEYNNNTNCKELMPAQNSPKPVQNKAYLYIQMQLCRKESLRDWLRENKTEVRAKHIGSIFRQIVDAVDYVHEKGLIHRDLKPSNIFFAPDGRVKIGDFGLVTDMSDCIATKCGDKSGLPSCARHTQQVGTQLYMSPEQLRGQRYDYKVDIYSLGLIFFELLVYFSTEMERIKTLRNLRDACYPNDFPDDYPAEFNLLKQMLSVKPEERPSTPDLKSKLNACMALAVTAVQLLPTVFSSE